MQFKLTELYNTRYFYITYKKDLVYLFNTIITLRVNRNHPYNIGNAMLGQVYEAAKSGAHIQVDLAGSKLTPDTVTTIQEYSAKGIEFIDTKDAGRNQILAVNRERLKFNKKDFVELPEYNPSDSVVDYLQTLNQSTIYMLPNHDQTVFIPLTYMILVVRPTIQIALVNYCSDFFNFVGNRLTLNDLLPYNEFYLTTPDGTTVVDFSKGPVYTQRIGAVDMEEALTLGTLVPTVLGKERLHKQAPWNSIFKYCLNSLNGYRATRKQALDEVL